MFDDENARAMVAPVTWREPWSQMVEPPAQAPTASGGEDKQEGPLPQPLERQVAALNRRSSKAEPVIVRATAGP
jgi:hypothetical protein